MTKIIADFVISKEFIVEDNLTMTQMSEIVDKYENDLNDFLFDFPGNNKINGVKWSSIDWSIEKTYD